jgi:hypothetical protein
MLSLELSIVAWLQKKKKKKKVITIRDIYFLSYPSSGCVHQSHFISPAETGLGNGRGRYELPFGDRKRKIGKECPTRSDLS